jgi:hypothetical protein
VLNHSNVEVFFFLSFGAEFKLHIMFEPMTKDGHRSSVLVPSKTGLRKVPVLTWCILGMAQDNRSSASFYLLLYALRRNTVHSFCQECTD